jgi:hypothetical protein
MGRDGVHSGASRLAAGYARGCAVGEMARADGLHVPARAGVRWPACSRDGSAGGEFGFDGDDLCGELRDFGFDAGCGGPGRCQVA